MTSKNKLNKLNQLKEYLKNKRVIIIGPSNSLLKKKNRELIDTFDVVVRVNRGIEPIKSYSEYIGTRTDILYNCLLEHPDNGGIIDIEFLKTNNLKYIVFHPEVSYEGQATNKIPKHINKKTLQNLNKNFKLNMIDYNKYNTISKQLKCRPNTGFIAIFDLLSYDIKELYITGYTFYLDNFMEGYKDHLDKKDFNKRNFNSKRHIQENMFQFLKSQKNKNKKIKTDEVLTQILELKNLQDPNKKNIKGL